MRSGASLAHVSKYNENAVIHALRALGPTSQTDVAEHTGLSVPAVSAIVRNLRDRGYLTEVGTEPVVRGRPRVIIDIVPSARYAIGLHIDPVLMSAVLLDLRGQVVRAATSEAVDPDDPTGSLDAAASLIRDVVDRSGVDPDRLVGACAAVPGPLDRQTGSIVDTVWLPGWTGIAIGDALTQRLGAPVPVIKDTLAAVIGENWVRAGESLESTMVFVYLGTGTGVGLSINGEPVGGSSGNAGEIGRMLVALAGPSKRGIENDPVGLVERGYREGVLAGDPPSPHDLRLQKERFRTLCAVAAGGDERAEAILRDAGGRIAEMVVMVSEVFDADTVVFGGPNWVHLQPFYEEPVVAALAKPSARGPHPVAVHSTAMGDTEVGAIGAACAVLDARFVPRAPGRLEPLMSRQK